MLAFVLDFLFPSKCGFCNRLNKEGICAKCFQELKSTEANIVENYHENKMFVFEQHAYLFLYKDQIRRKIIEFKFHDKPYLGKTFAKIMIKSKKICGFLQKYDIIIPVPMYVKKEKKRGYNQANLLAKEIMHQINRLSQKKEKQNDSIEQIQNLQYEPTILRKIVDTKNQSTLNKQERMENLKNAYKIVNAEKIKNKKIVLVDDIFTTGSTANECAKVLKQAGAKQVAVLTIAKD